MGNLVWFAVLLLVKCSYGYPPDSDPPEKIKLTSEPRYYTPDQKSDHPYENSKYESGVKYQRHDKEEDSTPNYDLYKPQDVDHSYGPTEEDSKYIPHSETYSKYIMPKKKPVEKHTWEDHSDHGDDTEKSEVVPRYGFKKENYHYPDHKHSGKEDEKLPKHHAEEDWQEKHPQPYKRGPNYDTHPSEGISDHKHNEYEDKHGKTYHDQKEKHGKHHYLEHKEEHETGHGKHPYPHYRESRIHHRNHHYPEHRKYPKVHHENPYYPEYRDHSKHHERHHHHHHHHHGEKPYENHHGSPHHPDHQDEHENHHENHHLKYQHWSDKHGGSFPKHDTKKYTEEPSKDKPHHVSSGPDGNSNHNIFHGEPHVEEFIKEHKLNSHHSPTDVHSDKPQHKEEKYADDSSKGHYFLKHYPHITKYQREHSLESFMNYKPNFNFGGHRHGWMYRPKFDIYQELRKDLDLKMRLLKEHEEKLAELQKNHLEKYHALFKPQHSKMFLHQELPKLVIPNFDHKHHSHAESHEEKHKYVNLPHKHHSGYPDYPKEQGYPSHESKHHLHHEIPHPHYESPLLKHDRANDKPKHHDSHHYKDDYAA